MRSGRTVQGSVDRSDLRRGTPDTCIGTDPALAEIDVNARDDLDALTECPRHQSIPASKYMSNFTRKSL